MAKATGVAAQTTAWAYCAFCKWTGPTRDSTHIAEADLALHEDAPGHHAIAAQSGRQP